MGNEGRAAKGKGKEVLPGTQDNVLEGQEDRAIGGTCVVNVVACYNNFVFNGIVRD
jgi:hypothetical protein